MLSFTALQSLVRHYTDPSHPGVYRRLYKLGEGAGPIQIVAPAEWRALPMITKEALSAETLETRSYLPLSELDHLRVSSGTSGAPPLFSPRTHVRGMEYRLDYHDFQGAFLAFTVPMMPHWHARFQKEHGMLPRVISFDPRFPRASIRLARAAGVTALSVFVYHMSDIAELMEEMDMSAQIRFIEITGEICTRAQLAHMQRVFPHATILQCRPLRVGAKEPIAVYHAKETHFLELVDRDSGTLIEPTAGAEGDLLVTTYPGEPVSFPLIRYRIGDTVRVVESNCPHRSWSFTVLGRTDLDFAKVPGGILRADEIARVLQLFPTLISDRFTMRVREEPGPKGPLLAPTLEVEPLAEIDLEQLARDIEQNLRTGPHFTWRQGVEAKRYMPLVCALRAHEETRKTRRIIFT
jgi:phenylacetate-coenzyme A ligase PaaK-like adenylate-forming protein